MKNIFALVLIVFGLVGCASGTLAIFPIDEYKDDVNAVELHFACLANTCISGLYLDRMQIIEGYGDYKAFSGGVEPKTKYIVMVPPSKYLVARNGVGHLDAFDRFIDINSKTCITVSSISFSLNIFATVKNDEGSWVKTNCNEYDEITEGYDLVRL